MLAPASSANICQHNQYILAFAGMCQIKLANMYLHTLEYWINIAPALYHMFHDQYKGGRWQLASLILGVVPVVAIVVSCYGRYLKKLSTKYHVL